MNNTTNKNTPAHFNSIESISWGYRVTHRIAGRFSQKRFDTYRAAALYTRRSALIELAYKNGMLYASSPGDGKTRYVFNGAVLTGLKALEQYLESIGA